MKTYEDLYAEYNEYTKNNADISEEEYNEIMNTPIALVDTFNRLVEYGRFALFTKKWIEDNKDELMESVKNNENKENE